jgi:hypothetical protein
MPELPMPSLIAYGLLVVLTLAALPIFPWSKHAGYANAGAMALALAVININGLIGHALG